MIPIAQNRMRAHNVGWESTQHGSAQHCTILHPSVVHLAQRSLTQSLGAYLYEKNLWKNPPTIHAMHPLPPPRLCTKLCNSLQRGGGGLAGGGQYNPIHIKALFPVWKSQLLKDAKRNEVRHVPKLKRVGKLRAVPASKDFVLLSFVLLL